MNTYTVAKGAELFRSLAAVWTDFWRRHSASSELDAFDRTELALLAQDVGLTVADLLAVARHDGKSAELLARRMEEFGIDYHHVDAAVLRDMQRCCVECEYRELCAHELEDKPKIAIWPGYCPNEQTLTALSERKCH